MIVTHKLAIGFKNDPRRWLIVMGQETIGNGKYSERNSYDMPGYTSKFFDYSREGLVNFLADYFEGRINKVGAEKFVERLERSRISVDDEAPRRIDPGAPDLGRPGLPVRPLAAVR